MIYTEQQDKDIQYMLRVHKSVRGIKIKEFSKVYNISIKAVRAKLHRMKEKLKSGATQDESQKSFTVQCPICGIAYRFKKIEKGQCISFFCHVQFYQKHGCGTQITIQTQ